MPPNGPPFLPGTVHFHGPNGYTDGKQIRTSVTHAFLAFRHASPTACLRPLIFMGKASSVHALAIFRFLGIYLSVLALGHFSPSDGMLELPYGAAYEMRCMPCGMPLRWPSAHLCMLPRLARSNQSATAPSCQSATVGLASRTCTKVRLVRRSAPGFEPPQFGRRWGGALWGEGRIRATKGWISVDRGSKATLPLTMPRRVFKSSAKDSARRPWRIALRGGRPRLVRRGSLAPDTGPWGREAPTVGRRRTAGASAAC